MNAITPHGNDIFEHYKKMNGNIEHREIAALPPVARNDGNGEIASGFALAMTGEASYPSLRGGHAWPTRQSLCSKTAEAFLNRIEQAHFVQAADNKGETATCKRNF